MQTNQNHDYGQYRGRSYFRSSENPMQASVRNEGTGSRPEVENPQPVRKVEDPITSNEQERTDRSGNSGGTNGRSGGDYRKSDVGFQPDTGQSKSRNKADQNESVMSQDDDNDETDQ